MVGDDARSGSGAGKPAERPEASGRRAAAPSGRLSRRGAGLFLLTLVLLVGAEAYVLFFRETGAAAHVPPASEIFLTPEAAGLVTVGQTLVMHADGLFALDLFPHPSERPVVGPAVITLTTTRSSLSISPLPDAVRLVELRVPADRIPVGRVWHLELPRVDQSAGLPLRLEIAFPQAGRGEGLRFEASSPGYTDGQGYWLNREAWGDLKFRTYAERTTIASTLAQRRRTMPPPLQGSAIWIVGLVLFNVALATLLYYLVFAPDWEWAPATALRADGRLAQSRSANRR